MINKHHETPGLTGRVSVLGLTGVLGAPGRGAASGRVAPGALRVPRILPPVLGGEQRGALWLSGVRAAPWAHLPRWASLAP